jgi:C-8 sterol isomerase
MYLFDPEKIHAIARTFAGKPIDESLPGIVSELERGWPGLIEHEPKWMLAIYGGTTATMTVLHASLSEYVLVYGSPIGTSGFSGRYLFDCWDFMLTGEMSTFIDDHSTVAEVYRPGDGALLPRGRAKGYSITPGSWMLEYSRGIIASGLPFALAEVAHSSPDLPTLARTLRIYGTQVVRNLLKGKI